MDGSACNARRQTSLVWAHVAIICDRNMNKHAQKIAMPAQPATNTSPEQQREHRRRLAIAALLGLRGHLPSSDAASRG